MARQKTRAATLTKIRADRLQGDINILAQNIAQSIARDAMHRALDKSSIAEPTAIGRMIGDVARAAAETTYGLHKGGQRRARAKVRK